MLGALRALKGGCSRSTQPLRWRLQSCWLSCFFFFVFTLYVEKAQRVPSIQPNFWTPTVFLGLRPPFTGPSRSKLLGHLFSLTNSQVLLSVQHRAGVRPNTSCYHFAESWVFNKLSSLPILCHLASFQMWGPPSPEVTEAFCRVPSTWLAHRLSILNQLTSVGLSTV